MHNVTFALEASLRILVVGLLLGAGLPAVFALGIRAQAYGEGGHAADDGDTATAGGAVGAVGGPPHLIGKVLAWLAFGVVIAGVLLGLGVIVASGSGQEILFDPFPTIIDKE